MDFTPYLPTQAIEASPSTYRDAVNHCKAYREYLVGDEKPSSVHEITHGINSDLRNGAIRSMPLPSTAVAAVPGTPLTMTSRLKYRPLKMGEGYNAFYLLENRAVKIPEPASRKRDCIQFIPQSLRGGRYSLYVSGQSEWDDSPLYLYDEWVAYRNGASCVVELIQGGDKRYVSYDFLYAPIEFIAYGVATLMAAPLPLDPTLRDFAVWMLTDVFNRYFQSMSLAPWNDADRAVGILQWGAEANDIRAFLKAQLDYDVPIGVR